jgi:CobQ-like glutamine amidotransferase family enzyme
MPKTNLKFRITHLYPEQMSIYGDYGNIIALKHRLSKYGLEVVYQKVNPKQKLPIKTDLYFIGGGQDKQQYEIFKDLIYKKQKLIEDIENNVPVLAICGGYQLLGQKFVTGEGLQIDGLGVFDVVTRALDSSVESRCVGNVIAQCLIPEIKKVNLVGFENHSGQTVFLSQEKSKPLAEILVGFGNNSEKKYEGCVYKNAIGTYLHGSCLPKNPELCDHLIKQALRRKAENGEMDPQTYIKIFKQKIDDTIALGAKNSILKRFL